MSDRGPSADFPSAIITELIELPEADAITRLRRGGWWTGSVAMELAEWALDQAEVNTTYADRALALAAQISAEHEEPPLLAGQIAYAQARRAVHNGDLAAAESALLVAQTQWRAADATVPYARTFLGLTQVLTMQGRFEDAAAAAQGAITALQPRAAQDPTLRMLLARAYRNRANLAVYQEQHAAARDDYVQAMRELEQLQAFLVESGAGDEAATLSEEFGHLALNLASAHTYLDDPDEAERLLRDAVGRFDAAQDTVNRGRAWTNLGRLHLRLGEYAGALRAFDAATVDLLGETAMTVGDDAEAELAALRVADELLLEHAFANLALNLLPEADLALGRCERLFRATGQPYELAQARYAQGMLHLQQGQFAASGAALDEAHTLFANLGNIFWSNRTLTARARLAVAQDDRTRAAVLLDTILAQTDLFDVSGAVSWDLMGLVDAWLLRLQLWLDAGEVVQAEALAQLVAATLEVDAAGTDALSTPLPHLTLRLLHARGHIATAQNDGELARRLFSDAVSLLDQQRASLPLEEVRTAYLGDKMALYSDLVLNLLAAPLPSEDEVAAAFAVVERARSRALLERLLAAVETVTDMEDEAAQAQRAALRRQLHWLYNQLLGESGNRRLDGTLGREVAQREAAIQQLEWRSAPLLAQAEPAQLDELQAILAADQQALVYYFAGEEVLAFVVAHDRVQVVRRLTTVNAIANAQAELRFQLGRAELGSEYVARHHARLLRGAQDALGRLYGLLVAPLEDLLTASSLLVVPYGALHLVPFHALWSGDSYWLEQLEISYVPSASIAIHKRRHHANVRGGNADVSAPLFRFAGFAPKDDRIPQAQAEIDLAARHFAEAKLFHNEAATVANLWQAAAASDVLHLATHGLFRPDNSFFSAIKLADGWIDVREIYRLRLAAHLVVLSACESGVGDVRAGDEIVGLARGFLAAGAEHLIATLWNVHDSSAARLMGNLYAYLQRGGTQSRDNQCVHRPAAALRAAQTQALHAGEHPYFWAPFFAIG